MIAILHTGDEPHVVRSIDIEPDMDAREITLRDVLEEDDRPRVRTTLSWSLDDAEVVAGLLMAAVARGRGVDRRQGGLSL